MAKRLINWKNIILVCIIAILVVLIIRQQSVLDEKRSEYEAEAETSASISKENEQQNLDKIMKGTASEEEDFARSEGYIYPDEKVIEYED